MQRTVVAITCLVVFGCGGSSSTPDSTSSDVANDSAPTGALPDSVADSADEAATAERTSLVSVSDEIPDDNNSGVLDAANQPSLVVDNCAMLQSGDYHMTELVTDVMLTAGQSNAAGANTLYEPEKFEEDQVNNRVLVWTDNNRWEVADPRTQTWHGGKFPSSATGNFNHPAFQIARAVAQQDKCRVVGIIATAAPGMPIDHWRHDLENHYTSISEKVTNAINALPGRHEIDMIWWMQGEADNDKLVSRYFWKLNQLINIFRSEAWFSSDGYFLANETKQHAYANEAINMLRHDGNEFTDYSRGEDSPTDPFPSIVGQEIAAHFNQVSLRKIGNLVADKYLNEYLIARSKQQSL